MQNKTIFLGSGKLSEKQFFVDVLYFGATSYSKSLYPTIDRYFKKYATEYMEGGTFSSTSDIIVQYLYKIMRTTYTKN